MNETQLVDAITQICYYAQEHTRDWEEVSPLPDGVDWDLIFQCTSYTVACFLAQYTKHGDRYGVSSGVVIGALKSRPGFSMTEWRDMVEQLVAAYVDDSFDSCPGLLRRMQCGGM